MPAKHWDEYREHELISGLPLAPPANWLPPLSMADAFIIDELAVWFCDGGLETGNYRWCEDDLSEIPRVLWEKKDPDKPL